MHKFAESDGVRICALCKNNRDGDSPAPCHKHEHIDGAPSLVAFLEAVEMEIYRARELYPSCEGVLAAMTEEVGEVAAAYLDSPREKIIKEAVQACAMVARLALEGDPSLTGLRAKRQLDT